MLFHVLPFFFFTLMGIAVSVFPNPPISHYLNLGHDPIFLNRLSFVSLLLQAKQTCSPLDETLHLLLPKKKIPTHLDGK